MIHTHFILTCTFKLMVFGLSQIFRLVMSSAYIQSLSCQMISIKDIAIQQHTSLICLWLVYPFLTRFWKLLKVSPTLIWFLKFMFFFCLGKYSLTLFGVFQLIYHDSFEIGKANSWYRRPVHLLWISNCSLLLFETCAL